MQTYKTILIKYEYIYIYIERESKTDIMDALCNP